MQKTIVTVSVTVFITVLILVSVLMFFQNKDNSLDRKVDIQGSVDDMVKKQEKEFVKFEVVSDSEKISSSFMQEFIEKISKMDRFNSYDDLKRDEKISFDNISQIFYSSDGKFIIALVSGTYGGQGFKLIRYNIETKNLEVAKREDIDGGKETEWFKIKDKDDKKSIKNILSEQKDFYSWFITPNKIVSLESENIIKLAGSSGDAGCSGVSYFEYDVSNNYIEIIEICSFCEGEEKEICTKY